MSKFVGIARSMQDARNQNMVVAVFHVLIFVVARTVNSLNMLLFILLLAVCVHDVRLLLFNLVLNVLLAV